MMNKAKTVFAYKVGNDIEKWVGEKKNLLRAFPNCEIVWEEKFEDYKKRLKVLNGLK